MPFITILCCGIVLVAGCRSVTSCRDAGGRCPALSGGEDRSRLPTATFGILFVDNTHNHPETGEGIPHAKRKGLNLFAYDGIAGIIEYVPWKHRKPNASTRWDSGSRTGTNGAITRTRCAACSRINATPDSRSDSKDI